MKNVEVEIKLAVTAELFERCEAYLKEHAEFQKIVTQKDEYFTVGHRNFLAPEYPFEWLSIRERGGKCTLSYKHWHPENAPVSTHCDEYDITISDAETMRLLLAAIDVKSLVVVDKTRRTYLFEGAYEIALDYVEDLGYYIEIEYSGTELTIEQANQRVLQVARTLGLEGGARDNRGYPYLMLAQKGLL